MFCNVQYLIHNLSLEFIQSVWIKKEKMKVSILNPYHSERSSVGLVLIYFPACDGS